MKTYKGQVIHQAYDLVPGIYALIDVSNFNHGTNEYWELRDDYGHKNMSGEVCPRGWLGSYNNVSSTACGCVEVFKDSTGRLRLRQVSDDALMEATDANDDDAAACADMSVVAEN